MTEQSPTYIAPAPAKYLTLVFKITSAEQQTKLLAEGQWIASCHSDAMAERDALQRRADALEQEAERLRFSAGVHRQAFVEAHSKVEHLTRARNELEAQLNAVGAGGVEPLRKSAPINDDVLHCDICSAECADPWHFSTATKKHMHACDGCWGNMGQHLTDAQILGLVKAIPALETADAEWLHFARALQSAQAITAAPQPPANGLESLPAMAREIFCNCYPAEIQKEIDDVIEWLASVVYVEMGKAQPPAPVRQPLTDERISDIVREAAKNSPIRRDGTTSHRIVRAVEAAHGITAPKPLWLPSDDTEGGAV